VGVGRADVRDTPFERQYLYKEKHACGRVLFVVPVGFVMIIDQPLLRLERQRVLHRRDLLQAPFDDRVFDFAKQPDGLGIVPRKCCSSSLGYHEFV